MQQLLYDLRKSTIGMLNHKMSASTMARALNVNVSTISRLARRFDEFGTTANCPHARRSRVTTYAQDRYIRILHLCDHLRPATATADKSVYSVYGFRLELSEIDRGEPISTRSALDVDWTSPLLNDDSNSLGSVGISIGHWHDGGMSPSVTSQVSCFTEQMGDSMGGAAEGRGMLMSTSYTAWHMAGEAYWFGWEYPINIVLNCMSLLVIWMLSDTAMRYCDHPAFRSSEKDHVLVWQCQTSSRPRLQRVSRWRKWLCAWLASISIGVVPSGTQLGHPWSGSSSPTSTSGEQ